MSPKKPLSWKQALAKKLFVRTKPDNKLSLQMAHIADVRQEFLREPIDRKFIALHIEAYYDIIRELLQAHMYKRGWDCRNFTYLPIYALHHIHHFHEEAQKIQELFAVKQKIHDLDTKTIQKYLQKNHEALDVLIRTLRERLHEI